MMPETIRVKNLLDRETGSDFSCFIVIVFPDLSCVYL